MSHLDITIFLLYLLHECLYEVPNSIFVKGKNETYGIDIENLDYICDILNKATLEDFEVWKSANEYNL